MLNMSQNLTVFKKLHANSEDEQLHIACLLYYKHVITKMGYQICPPNMPTNFCKNCVSDYTTCKKCFETPH